MSPSDGGEERQIVLLALAIIIFLELFHLYSTVRACFRPWFVEMTGRCRRRGAVVVLWVLAYLFSGLGFLFLLRSGRATASQDVRLTLWFALGAFLTVLWDLSLCYAGLPLLALWIYLLFLLVYLLFFFRLAALDGPAALLQIPLFLFSLYLFFETSQLL